MRPPAPGAPAPRLELPTSAGEVWSLNGARGRRVMLSFLGPSNCHFCRGFVIRLIQARERIARLGTDVVLVAYHDPELVMTQMMQSLNLPYLLLVDKSRRAYADWGMGAVTARAFLHPGLYWAIAKLILSRPEPLGDVDDRSLVGGDFVIDREGRLAFVHTLRSLHDRANVEDMLSVVERI
jgi:peroxiredoxin